MNAAQLEVVNVLIAGIQYGDVGYTALLRYAEKNSIGSTCLGLLRDAADKLVGRLDYISSRSRGLEAEDQLHDELHQEWERLDHTEHQLHMLLEMSITPF